MLFWFFINGIHVDVVGIDIGDRGLIVYGGEFINMCREVIDPNTGGIDIVHMQENIFDSKYF